jgi:hypothetical protein
MQSAHSLSAVPDDELRRRLAALVHESRKTEADLVAHIGEVDVRRLYAREAVPSVFQYCTERLHLSGAEAHLRIAAARAAREHPAILTMLGDGRLHLTAIAMLSPHLTPENRDTVLERATHRTKREIEELLSEIAPRPDAPALIRKLPERRAADVLPTSADPGAPLDPPASPTGAQESFAGESGPAIHERDVAGTPVGQLRPDGVASGSPRGTMRSAWRVEPLSPSRYRVEFTASAELREKLERLQNSMRTSVPDGDLAAVIDAAVTEKLERIERRRFGRTEAPRGRGERRRVAGGAPRPSLAATRLVSPLAARPGDRPQGRARQRRRPLRLRRRAGPSLHGPDPARVPSPPDLCARGWAFAGQRLLAVPHAQPLHG